MESWAKVLLVCCRPLGPRRLHPLGLGCHRLVQVPGRTEEQLVRWRWLLRKCSISAAHWPHASSPALLLLSVELGRGCCHVVSLWDPERPGSTAVCCGLWEGCPEVSPTTVLSSLRPVTVLLCASAAPPIRWHQDA